VGGGLIILHPLIMERLSDSFDCFVINDRLRENFGLHGDFALPRFRVVHSDDQLEKRYGTFSAYAGDIFLREETGIREIPKYPWLDNQWVLERLFPNIHQDVYEGNCTYEPLWAYPTGLPLNWDMIEAGVKKALDILPVDTVEIPKTEKEATYRVEEEKEKERKSILNQLDNTSVQSALHDGAAVTVPNEVFRG